MSFGIIMPETTIEPSKSTDQKSADVPSGDLISRADAIEAVKGTKPIVRSTERNWGKMIAEQHSKELVKALKALPSAEPKGANLINRHDATTVIREECLKCSNITNSDLLCRILSLPTSQQTDCTEFIEWLVEVVLDDEDWELNAVAYGEIIARKLKKLGLLEVKDGYYVRVPSADRPQVNSNSAEEQIAETCDRPKGDPEPEPEPVVVYICDRRRCAICRGEDGGCDHTTDIKHAAHFKNVAGQYFERPYMEEEDDG